MSPDVEFLSSFYFIVFFCPLKLLLSFPSSVQVSLPWNNLHSSDSTDVTYKQRPLSVAFL